VKIYFDTEFVSLWRPEMMSVGFAAEDGSTLYLEVPFKHSHLSRFSREVVLPLLEGGVCAMDESNAREAIRRFLGQYNAPELVCDFIGDWWLLLAFMPDLPDYAIPCCALHGAPDLAYKDPRQRHHALADAIALRDFKPAIQQDAD
jgi:hypothetical protein